MTPAPTEVPWSYEVLRSRLQLGGTHYRAVYNEYRLSSYFQPIVSLTHARVVGHEGLLRPLDSGLRPVAPYRVLNQVKDNPDELLTLDRLCRLLHMANVGKGNQGWLFLNMHPRVFATRQREGVRGFSTKACQEFGIKREHIVLELLEHSLRDEAEFADAVQNIHKQGYLVALDDFGAGHSNFDRVWKVSPEIVKLDRVFATGAESDPRIRRLLPRIVALLHEAGAFVLLEGIETHTQAMVALDANIDFAQGNYFGKPQAETLPIHSVVPAAAALWQNFESDISERERATQARLATYKIELAQAAKTIISGAAFETACAGLMALPDVECCYLLDADGRTVGSLLWRADQASAESHLLHAARFAPVSTIGGARWSRRPYFRNAMDNIGTPQASAPYLSSSSAHVCVTVSMAFEAAQQTFVICGDIVWE